MNRIQRTLSEFGVWRCAVRYLVPAVLSGALAVRDQSPHADGGELEFEYTGCAEVRPGPVCELASERELTIWVAGSAPPIIAGATSERIRQSQLVEGGTRVTFRVPEGQSRLQLRVGKRRASLRVSESSESKALRELERWWKEGKWQRVRARLDQAPDALVGTDRDAFRCAQATTSARRRSSNPRRKMPNAPARCWRRATTHSRRATAARFVSGNTRVPANCSKAPPAS
jgi:hypothetical protein